MTLQRGCGTRKSDSFYLTCKTGVNGKAPIQWALGTPLAGNGCLLTLPSRGIRLDVDVPSTLILRHGPLIIGSRMADIAKRDVATEKLSGTILGNVGIANHVGHDKYNPKSYYEEAWNFGASFKISKKLVPQILESCGSGVYIPVLVAQKLPVWHDRNHYYTFAEKYFSAYLDGRTVEKETWRTEGFGLFDKEMDWLGADHFQQPLLDWIDTIGWAKASAALSEEKILTVEQPFAVALCTGIRYTGNGSVKPAPDEAYLPGVEWVYPDEYQQMAIDLEIELNELTMAKGSDDEWEYRK